MTIVMDKPKVKNKVTLTSAFINSKLPIKVKWILIKLLSEVDDYTLSIADYERIISQFSVDNVNQFSCYSPFIKIDYVKGIVTFDKIKLKRRGIYVYNKPKYKEVDVDFNKLTNLLEAFNSARIKYLDRNGMNNKNRETIVAKPTTMHIYKNLIDFLQEHGINNWYLYFYCLYEYHEWKVAWNPRSCANEKCLQMYLTMKDKCQQIIDGKEPVKINYQTSRWINTFDHIEKTKKRYIDSGRHQLCMKNTDDTLGYHPLSNVCLSCPIQNQCASAIYTYFKIITKSDLDIIKLRNLDVTVTEAKDHLNKLGVEFDFYE